MHATAILYCQQAFDKALAKHKSKKQLHAAFEALGKKIAAIKGAEALHRYSLATQWLETASSNPADNINPMDVLVIRAESLLEGSHPKTRKAAYAMAVIAITLSVLVVGLAIGLGIGLLTGLWATPIGFLTALATAEKSAVVVAGVSAAVGLGAAGLSAYSFFKEPGLKQPFRACVHSIKSLPLTEVVTDTPTKNPTP